MRRAVGFALLAISVAFGCMTSGSSHDQALGVDPQPRELDPASPWTPCCLEVYEENLQHQYGCTSGLECCSNVCTMDPDASSGFCTCAAVGGYCFVNSDCCQGTCNTDQGCCLDDAGNCPNDGGNPWLDGQL